MTTEKSVALTTEQVLREEAKAIHGEDIPPDANLYQELNKLDSAALCLSGGGIRSAAFGLGVIQALAVHPRSIKGEPVGDSKESLLAKLHYVSTVSGGGYIGSWLAAWINRTSFQTVWQNLVGRPSGPDTEPPSIAWLRTYSNYLTPKLGAMSADTWTAVAIAIRNLLLNWLVILPVFCCVLLALKLYALAVAWIARASPQLCMPFFSADNPTLVDGAIGIVLLLIGLAFRSYNLPTRKHSHATQGWFLTFDLLPTALGALALVWAVAAPCVHVLIENYKVAFLASNLNATIWYGVVGGAALYVLGWLLGRPTYKGADIVWTLAASAAAGAVFGVLMAWGVDLAHQAWLAKTIEAPFGTAEILFLVLGVPWVLVSQLIAEMLFVALTNKMEDSDADREWLGRAAGWLLVAALAWVVFMALVYLSTVWIEIGSAKLKAWLVSAGGISGVLTALLGKSKFTGGRDEKTKSPSGLHLSLNVILVIVAVIFAVAVLVLTSALLDQWLIGKSFIQLLKDNAKGAVDGYASWPPETAWLVGGFVAAFVIGFGASKFININRFSLHALYRNRIARAFLGASNPTRAETRNPFTDFDESDNLPISKLWPSPRPANDGWRPFNVINMALNIVSSKKLAWQERKAAPFTVTALHSGSSCKRYRPSKEYGHLNRGISLSTAVAVSGAAASPNMGYHSSPGITFLLALLNVRLGWWLGNPGEEGEKTYQHEGPLTAIRPLLAEMFGLTTDDNKYIYLSDGGHFENLGLYEMVRRRCRLIIVSDAGCDPKFEFEDLGNAVRKIWLDLGVRIEFYGVEDLKTLTLDKDGKPAPSPIHGLYHAIGIAHYPDADKGGKYGLILYIKPAYHGIENIGVRSYALANPDFPHQGTGDQFFSESQFESYRALGFEITDKLLRAAFSESGRPKAWSVEEIGESLAKTVRGAAA